MVRHCGKPSPLEQDCSGFVRLYGGTAASCRCEASTEDLRRAMIHYRTLFDDLVHEPELSPDATVPRHV